MVVSYVEKRQQADKTAPCHQLAQGYEPRGRGELKGVDVARNELVSIDDWLGVAWENDMSGIRWRNKRN